MQTYMNNHDFPTDPWQNDDVADTGWREKSACLADVLTRETGGSDELVEIEDSSYIERALRTLHVRARRILAASRIKRVMVGAGRI